MSRLIDFSLASHGQPWTSTAAAWEQTAFNEQDAAAVIAQIGNNYNPSTVYILYGCELSSTAGTTTVTTGMLFTNSVFVRMNAASYADPVGPAVSIVNYVDTFGDGAGTIFADGFTANVLKNRNAVCLAGTSGSGAVGNYVDLVPALPICILGAAGLNGQTFYFTQDAYYEYGTAGVGAIGFTIDFTGNPKPGARLTINAFTGGLTTTITIAVTGTAASGRVLGEYSTLTAMNRVSYEIIFLGFIAGSARYSIQSYAYA